MFEKKYKFKNENGEIENVEKEVWGWGVIYKDNTELNQFGFDGKFHQFREIEQKNVKMFVLYKLNDMSKRIDMPVVEGMQIFHFYRNIKTFYNSEFKRIYVFGWKIKGSTSYNFILPDDRIITSPVDNINLVEFNV